MFGYQGSSKAGVSPIQHSTVALLSDYTYSWIGMLGLDARPSNFTELGGMDVPQKSLMQKLKDSKSIPSISYSYTAGSSGLKDQGKLLKLHKRKWVS